MLSFGEMCGPINVKECYEKKLMRGSAHRYSEKVHMLNPEFIEVHMKIFRSSLDTKKKTTKPFFLQLILIKKSFLIFFLR
jgi:hypothetical protein